LQQQGVRTEGQKDYGVPQYTGIFSARPAHPAVSNRLRCGVRFAFGFHALLVTHHSELDFWHFPSFTTTTPCVLENSRKRQKISPFLPSIFWITFGFLAFNLLAID
jgi:hypothetical protein